MTSKQLETIKRIRHKLDDIRGNEEEVSELKSEVDQLIHDGITEAKMKIDVLASHPEEEESVKERVGDVF